jgi:hypothetical protein
MLSFAKLQAKLEFFSNQYKQLEVCNMGCDFSQNNPSCWLCPLCLSDFTQEKEKVAQISLRQAQQVTQPQIKGNEDTGLRHENEMLLKEVLFFLFF